MKKSRPAAIFPLFCIVLCCVAYGQDKFDPKTLDTYLANAVKESRTPGLAVGILKDGQTVFAKGYGVRSVETGIPVDPKTRFYLGSCSKAFTAASVGILVDDGKLRWDDKVVDHLPWFSLADDYITKELTVGDLLCHRSGLGTFAGDLLWFGTHYTGEEVVRRIREVPVKSGFRAKFEYQNVMFIVAGLVVEAAAGKPWPEFVKERLFEPLQMNGSATSLAAFKAGPNVAIPHFEGRPLAFIDFDNVGPAGGISSSVEDMLKWLKMWLDDGKMDDRQVLSPRTVRTITSSQMVMSAGPGTEPMGTHFVNYGYGWRLMDYAGRKVIFHSGAIPGYVSQVVFVPEEKLGLVILANDLTPIPNAISNKILDLFMTDKDKDYVQQALNAFQRYQPVLEKRRKERLDKQTPNTSPSLGLSDYAGIYRDKMYGEAEVIEQDGALVLSFLPARELFTAPLEHFHYDTFKVQFDVPRLDFGFVTFRLNADGKVQDFVVDLTSQDLDFSGLVFVKQAAKKTSGG